MATMGVLAGGIVLGTGILNGTTTDSTATSGSGTTSGGGSSTGGGGSASGGTTTGGTTGGNTASGAKDGTFTGDTVQTRYGPMQVEITIKNGKITAANALQHPGGDQTSTQINSQVIPILVKATTDYQSVQFGNVSRATISTNAYKQSAQSALDQAGFTG